MEWLNFTSFALQNAYSIFENLRFDLSTRLLSTLQKKKRKYSKVHRKKWKFHFLFTYIKVEPIPNSLPFVLIYSKNKGNKSQQTNNEIIITIGNLLVFFCMSLTFTNCLSHNLSPSTIRSSE